MVPAQAANGAPTPGLALGGRYRRPINHSLSRHLPVLFDRARAGQTRHACPARRVLMLVTVAAALGGCGDAAVLTAPLDLGPTAADSAGRGILMSPDSANLAPSQAMVFATSSHRLAGRPVTDLRFRAQRLSGGAVTEERARVIDERSGRFQAVIRAAVPTRYRVIVSSVTLGASDSSMVVVWPNGMSISPRTATVAPGDLLTFTVAARQFDGSPISRLPDLRYHLLNVLSTAPSIRTTYSAAAFNPATGTLTAPVLRDTTPLTMWVIARSEALGTVDTSVVTVRSSWSFQLLPTDTTLDPLDTISLRLSVTRSGAPAAIPTDTRYRVEFVQDGRATVAPSGIVHPLTGVFAAPNVTRATRYRVHVASALRGIRDSTHVTVAPTILSLTPESARLRSGATFAFVVGMRRWDGTPIPAPADVRFTAVRVDVGRRTPVTVVTPGGLFTAPTVTLPTTFYVTATSASRQLAVNATVVVTP